MAKSPKPSTARAAAPKSSASFSWASLFIPRSQRAAAILLAWVCAATYFPALFNSFTYDDVPYILENQSLRKTWKLPLLFAETYPPEKPALGLYRPIVSLSFLFDYQLGMLLKHSQPWEQPPRPSPLTFHLTSLVLHFISSWLVYLLAQRFFGTESTQARLAATLCALLFAVHPAHVEAVASAVGRAELLAFIGVALGLLAWDRVDPSRPLFQFPILAAMSAYLFGLLGKENAFVFPGLAIVWTWARLLPVSHASQLKIQNSKFKTIVPYLVLTLPLFVVAAAYFALRVKVTGSPGIQETETFFYIKEVDGPARPAAALIGFLMHLKLLVWPTRLVATYPFPFVFADHIWIQKPHSIFEPAPLAGLALLILALAALAFAFFRRRAWGFGLTFILISLLPVSNIIPFGDLVAERFLYLPSFGLCLLVAAPAARWLAQYERDNVRFKRLLVVAALLIALLGVRSAVRCADWRNSLVFWEKLNRQLPDYALTWYGVAQTHDAHAQQDNRHLEAIKGSTQYAEVVRLKDSIARHQLAALENYLKATELEPEFYEAHYNRALIFFLRGEQTEARRHLQAALRAYPKNLKFMHMFYFQIGLTWVAEKNYAASRDAFLAALRFKPNNATYWTNLGSAYASLRDYAHAEQAWRRALTLEPLNPDARRNLDKLLALKAATPRDK